MLTSNSSVSPHGQSQSICGTEMITFRLCTQQQQQRLTTIVMQSCRHAAAEHCSTDAHRLTQQHCSQPASIPTHKFNQAYSFSPCAVHLSLNNSVAFLSIPMHFTVMQLQCKFVKLDVLFVSRCHYMVNKDH